MMGSCKMPRSLTGVDHGGTLRLATEDRAQSCGAKLWQTRSGLNAHVQYFYNCVSGLDQAMFRSSRC